MSLSVRAAVRRDGFVAEGGFEVSAGETVVLLGPNGAGKSTLVELIAGLLRAERGEVRLDEQVVDDGAGVFIASKDRRIGVSFQDRLLFPHMAVVDNVAFPLRARGHTKDEARTAALRVLRRLDVDDLASRRPGDLSGGEAQRVALARALAAGPRLLLLDEPMAALDVSSRIQIRAMLAQVLSGFDGMALLVTHDPVDALTLADRIVIVEDGRITQTGTPDEIRDAPTTRYAADLVGVNLFRGTFAVLEPGVGRIATLDGTVVAGFRGDAPEGDVLGLLSPADVSLHLERPEGSPRNVLRGTVSSIDLAGERARVRVDASPQVVAEVTLGSVSQLGLRVGLELWVSFKAVEVRLIPE